MPYSPRPTLRRTWPAVAASIATFAGMTSCIATVMPLSLFGAPLLGAGIVAGLFSLLLALGPSAPDEREQRDRIRFAAAIAWMVSVATCWRFARSMQGGTDEASRMYDGTIGQIAISGGVVVGLAVAWIIMRIGMAQYRRALAFPDGATFAQRLGIEPREVQAARRPVRDARSTVRWLVIAAIGGYLGYLLTRYWMLIGLAPRDARVSELGALVGGIVGGIVAYLSGRYPMRPPSPRGERPTAP